MSLMPAPPPAADPPMSHTPSRSPVPESGAGLRGDIMGGLTAMLVSLPMILSCGAVVYQPLGGGFVAARDGKILAELALPIAGLFSGKPFVAVREDLLTLRHAVRAMGCTLAEPFIQLAFLPLPVIPHLKLTDMGLVDVDRFELIRV